MENPSGQSARRAALRSFLIERRRRIRPENVGLPARGESREGLRQADVAELAGVSLNWYELFESGRDDRRVSTRFVGSVARVLQLDEADTLELLRLAVPDTDASAWLNRSTKDGALATLRSIRNLVRKLSSASDLDEVARLAAFAIQDVIKPDSTTTVTLQREEGASGFSIGPRGKFATKETHKFHWENLRDMPVDRVAAIPGGPTIGELMQRRADVDVIGVGDDQVPLDELRLTPEIYHDALFKIRAASGLTLPLVDDAGLRGLVGATWTEPRSISPLEIEIAKTVAAIVQLIMERRAS